MGLFGGDSSSSTSNQYNTDNSNIGSTGGGLAARGNITLTDPGAVDLAKKSLDTVSAAVGKTLDASNASQATAFDFLKSSFDKTLTFTGDTIAKANQANADALAKYQSQATADVQQIAAFATDQNKQSVQQLTENVFRYGAWLLVGLGITAALYAYAQHPRASHA